MAFGITNHAELSDDKAESLFTARQVARATRLGGSALSDNKLVIPASGSNGFDIFFEVRKRGVTGDFGGLVQDFSSLDEGLSWAERAFLEDYRLRIDCVGAKPCRWTLEKMVRDGGVVDIISSGYIVLFPTLRNWTVAYRQNSNKHKMN